MSSLSEESNTVQAQAQPEPEPQTEDTSKPETESEATMKDVLTDAEPRPVLEETKTPAVQTQVQPQADDTNYNKPACEAVPVLADVLVDPERPSVLEANPRLLTLNMMQQLATKGLPSCLEMKRWKRLFSVRRDGDSFLTFMNSVSGHKFTLMVVQTTDDDIFGSLVDTEWGKKRYGRAVDMHHKFFGTGQSFLFKVDKDKDKAANDGSDDSKENSQDHPNVSVYKWTGRNNYNQLISKEDAMLGMGGGGSSAEFGLCIRDSFGCGTSGSCDTFGNPPLASRPLFDILRFEVYGFVRHTY